MISLQDLLNNFGFVVAAGLALAWALAANRTKAKADGPPWHPDEWQLSEGYRVPSLGYLNVTAGKAPRPFGFLSQLRLDTMSTGPRLTWILALATIGLAIAIGSLWSLMVGLGLLGLLSWQTAKTSRLVSGGVRGHGKVLELSDGPTFFSYGTAQVALTDPKLGKPIGVALPWWPLRSLSRQTDVAVLVLFDPKNPENNLFLGIEAANLPAEPPPENQDSGDNDDE